MTFVDCNMILTDCFFFFFFKQKTAYEISELEQKIGKAGMPKEARDKAAGELNKLKMMSPMSAEATVVRNYIDWLLKVPWKKRTKVIREITRAQKVQDEDH